MNSLAQRTIPGSLLLFAILLTALHAQTGTSAPEVRRALPVNDSNGAENFFAPSTPSSQNIPGSIPVMKALPSESPTQTIQPSSTPQSISPADPEGSIRIGPSSTNDPATQAAMQLSVADGFYARKQPASAVPEYEKFLIISGKQTPGRERAIYRLGESQRMMGSSEASERSFLQLLSEYPSSELAASASFRLGELRENRSDYATAADNFSTAAKKAADPSIRLAALYHQALCLEKSGHTDQSEILFQNVTHDIPTGTEKNPYRIPTLMHLASNAAVAGKKEQALEYYTQVISSNPSDEVASEASLKAALLDSELGKTKEAKKLFEKVASSENSGHWQGIARLGVLRLAAQSGDQEAILKASEKALATDSENKPEILLLRAIALRKTGRNAKALESYDEIIREFPGSKEASQAPFQRLLALHAERSPALLTEIDQYLLTASDPNDVAKAKLLKAEETLRHGKYKEAAQFYHDIPLDSLPLDSKTDILYKEAWALVQSGDQAAAIAALTRFLQTYPADGRASAALAQRALIKQQQKDFTGAIADYSLLQENYPKATERELALQQKALILGQQQQNKEMADAFRQLLNDYPKSTAAPQAHYWIGWTAMENKDYPTAITELTLARNGDPKQFGERAGLRILLAEYYQNHALEASREAATLKPSLIPPEVGRWLGLKAMESGNASQAEHFLKPLVGDGQPGAVDSEIQGTLAAALILQKKFKEAQLPAAASLKLAHDPASRAKALLVSANIQRSLKNIPQAFSMTEEAMLLQPEGVINAEARILNGDLLVSKQDYAGAAKAYMTVAVLYDDPVLAPKALTRAIDAYRHSGNLEEVRKTTDELHKRFPNVSAPVTPAS